MNVRLKKEIISLGMNHIKSLQMDWRGDYSNQFQATYRCRRRTGILDTCNEYECKIGTFANAIELDIRSFRDFPRAVSELGDELKDKQVVMFCTGGIRCEKASVLS